MLKRCLLFLSLLLPSLVGAGGNIPFMFIPKKVSGGGAGAFTWTGLAGDNLWNTPGNWSGSVVPGSGDTATFQGANCSGANCNATINVAISIAGIQTDSAYTGTITQGSGNTVAIGTAGWNQAGGTFTGGNSNITITSGTFSLTGGIFTSTSANLKIAAASGSGLTVFSQSAGTFNANAGTLYFTIDSAGCVNGTHYVIDVNTTMTVAGLRYAGGHPSSANTCYWDLGSGDSLTTTGTFDTTRDFAAGGVASSGTINAQGNINYGTGANGGTLVVNATGTATQNFSQTASTTLPSGAFTVNKTGGSLIQTSNIVFNGGDFVVQNGIFDGVNYTSTGINIFNLQANGTWRTYGSGITATTWTYVTGCTKEWTGNINWGGWVAPSQCNNVINKTAGSFVTVGATAVSTQSLTILSGTVNNGAGGITITGSGGLANSSTMNNGTYNVTFTGSPTISGNTTFYNLTKSGAGTMTFAAGSTQTITNSLTLQGVSAGSKLLLRSSSSGTQWKINASGSRTLGYLDVQDSNNLNATPMDATTNSTNSGNNTNWVFGASFNWTGLAGDNLWSTPGNWSGGSVPGTSDTAVFQGASCSGANCNATINASISVGGIVTDSAYTGTITQGSGNTISLGTSGWTQSNGTFTGSNANFTLTAGAFSQAGGTFTAPTATFLVQAASGASATVMSKTGGTFTGANADLYLTQNGAGCTGAYSYALTMPSASFKTIRFAGGHASTNNTCTWNATTTLTSLGAVTIQRDFATGGVALDGAYNVGGDLTLDAGTNGGTGSITMNGSVDQNVSHNSGTWPNGNFNISKTGGQLYFATNVTFNNNYLYLYSPSVLDRSNKTLSGLGYYYIGSGAKERTYQPNGITTASWGYQGGCIFELYGATSINWWWTSANCSIIINKTTGYAANFTSNPTHTWYNFTVQNGSANLGSQTLQVDGNWSNLGGSWSPGTGTVTLSGSSAVYGSTTFYNLNLAAASNGTMTFEAGTTQTITNSLTLNGSSFNYKLKLRSSVAGTQWNINASGTRNISFLDVKDSNNTNATPMAAADTSLDSGNNTNWTFLSAGTEKKVFLSSVAYDGNLGGVAGADAKCATLATNASLAGTYKAWISVTTGTDDPATTFTHSTVPYKLVNGTTIANNWAGLTSGTISAAISLDENGATPAATNRWTNTTTSGTASSSGSGNSTNCVGWTNNASGGKNGRYGSSGATNSTWTDNGATNTGCNGLLRLICVQQY